LTIEWLTPGAVCVYMLDKCDRFYYLNLFWRHCCRVISRAGFTVEFSRHLCFMQVTAAPSWCQSVVKYCYCV